MFINVQETKAVCPVIQSFSICPFVSKIKNSQHFTSWAQPDANRLETQVQFSPFQTAYIDWPKSRVVHLLIVTDISGSAVQLFCVETTTLFGLKWTAWGLVPIFMTVTRIFSNSSVVQFRFVSWVFQQCLFEWFDHFWVLHHLQFLLPLIVHL